MNIPLARPFYDEREASAVAPVIRSGWVSQGPKAVEFEQRLAAWIGAEHAVATNSCTSAMQIALHLSGVGPGDEVICPSFTCMATANAILQVGARPAFVDIEPRTFNMDPRAVEAAVTARTRAIMVVHQIGLPADLDAMTAIASSAGLRIVEDAGCALGAAYKGRRIGGGDYPACFSLHPRKTITTGEGGVLTVKDGEFAERARAYRSHGASVSALERHQAGGLLYGSYAEVGHNFRFTDIQAAIGLVQVDKLDEILRRKMGVAEHYSAVLSEHRQVIAPVVPEGYRHAWQSYLVTLTPDCAVDRDTVIEQMGAHGVTCLRGIAPLHHEPVFARTDGDLALPHTADAYRHTMFLPIFAAMTAAEIDHVMTHFVAAIGGTMMAAAVEPPYFSVVMPVFNEDRNVVTAIATLTREFDEALCSFEIVVIDDGSVDDTVAVVQELIKNEPRIRLYRHRRNMGPGVGVYTGMAVARGIFVIFVPADLAMSPGELGKFIAASHHADVVNGLRSDRRDYSVLRKCMSVANIALIRFLFGMKLRQFNYIQAYRRAMFDRFYPRSMGVFITAEILVLARDNGFKTVEVEIDTLPRLIGTTGVANWRSIKKTLVELAAFWLRRVGRRLPPAAPFDADAYRRDHVLPLLTQDSSTQRTERRTG